MHALINRSCFAKLALLTIATLLSACSTLNPNFETPTVTVTSFKTLPSSGVMPEFEIGLRVINPNGTALKLRGVAYSVQLDGKELVKGVSNQLPIIDAYGSGDVTLTAVPSLLAGVRLVTELLNRPNDTVSYALEAKLDVGAFLPAIRVRDEGNISLTGN